MQALRFLAVAAALCVAAVNAAPRINFDTEDKGEMRLLEFSETDRRWVSVADIPNLPETGYARGFIDVTDHLDMVPYTYNSFVEAAFPTKPSKQKIVDPLLRLTSAENLFKTTSFLANYGNRYYTSNEGVASAFGLMDKFNEMITASGRKDASVRLFNHSGFPQASVIATIEGSDPDLKSEIIALGAHLDSVTKSVPGADDDASGVANVLEVFRVLIEAGFKPKRTIEFMAFAAEEVGLRGSIDIANKYSKEKKNILTLYNCEMSGYTKKRGASRTVTVLRDYVDKAATDFLVAIVKEYCELTFLEEKCGYACSDQASFQKVGYKTVCAAEAGPRGELNPAYHTASDTVDKLDFEYSLEFTKLALAFAVELSEF